MRHYPSRALTQVGLWGVAVVAACVVLANSAYWLEPTSISLQRPIYGGQVTVVTQGGFHLKSPLTLINEIDLRPQRVCISTSAKAAYNCKLVRFVGEEWQTFVRTEGFRAYWWSNRFSLNTGYPEEYRGFRDILRGYAFSATPYPFINEEQGYD